MNTLQSELGEFDELMVSEVFMGLWLLLHRAIEHNPICSPPRGLQVETPAEKIFT